MFVCISVCIYMRVKYVIELIWYLKYVIKARLIIIMYAVAGHWSVWRWTTSV